jgi:hypothetical protein
MMMTVKADATIARMENRCQATDAAKNVSRSIKRRSKHIHVASEKKKPRVSCGLHRTMAKLACHFDSTNPAAAHALHKVTNASSD